MLLKEIDKQTIDISERLDEGMLGKLLMGIGLALLGHETYTVVRGKKNQIDALKDFVAAAKLKRELADEMLELWRSLRDAYGDSKKARDEFHRLTGIKLKLDGE